MNARPFIPLIAAVLLLLVAGGLYGFGYHQLYAGQAKLEALTKDLAIKSAELDRIAKARVALATLAIDEALLRQYSIGKDDIVTFLERLQATGKPLGATVDVLSVANEKVGTHARVALSLSITGSFDAVLRTLGAIEYGPYDGVITTLALDTPDGKTWTAATVYSVGLATSTPSGKPAGAAPVSTSTTPTQP